MDDSRQRTLLYLLLVVALALGTVAVLAVTFLDFPRDRITVAAVALGGVLVVVALALPALILSGWQLEGE